jgi:hypothetical protein
MSDFVVGSLQLNTIVLIVVLRTMMRSISVSAKIGTEERSSVRSADLFVPAGMFTKLS